MDDEDGRCLLDVICDPQALNDFLHGSETQLDADDLLECSADPSSSFFSSTGGNVPEAQASNQLSASVSADVPSGSVDLDFLEDDDILGGSPSGGGGVGTSSEPCDILQQSLAEANITEQSLQEADAELGLAPFGLSGLTHVVQTLPDAGLAGAGAAAMGMGIGVGLGGSNHIFPGPSSSSTATPPGATPDIIGPVLTHPGLQLQPPGVNKTISVQPFIQQVGLGNVTLQPISSLQALPNGSQSGQLGIGQIQVVGQPAVMAINQSGQPILAKTIGGYQLQQPGLEAGMACTQAGLGSVLNSAGAGGLLIQGSKTPLGSPALNVNGAAGVGASSPNVSSSAGATLPSSAGLVGFGGASISAGIAAQQKPLSQAPIVQNVVIQRTPTPIQPKPPQGGVIQPRLYKQQQQPPPQPQLSAPSPLQNESGKAPGVQQGQVPVSAGQNVAFLAGKPGSNVVLSAQTPQGASFPQALFKTQAPQATGKPLSVHLLNQSGSIVIPSQAVLQGQNHQFLLPQLQAGGQILAQHPGGHIITSQGPGGQLIANQILAANQNLNLGQVLTSQGHPGAAHILSGNFQLQPGQMSQPTLIHMPVSLAQAQAQHATTVIQGAPIQNSLAMLGQMDSLSPAVSLQPPPQQAVGGIPSNGSGAVTTVQCQPGDNACEQAAHPVPPAPLLAVQASPSVSTSLGPSTLSASSSSSSSSTPSALAQAVPQVQQSPGKLLLAPQASGMILSRESLQMFLQQEQPPKAETASPPSGCVPASVIVSSSNNSSSSSAAPPTSGHDSLSAETWLGQSSAPSLSPSNPTAAVVYQIPAAGHQQQAKVLGASPLPPVTVGAEGMVGPPSLRQTDSPQGTQPSPLLLGQQTQAQPVAQVRPPSRSCTPSSLPPLFVIHNQACSSPQPTSLTPPQPQLQSCPPSQPIPFQAEVAAPSSSDSPKPSQAPPAHFQFAPAPVAMETKQPVQLLGLTPEQQQQQLNLVGAKLQALSAAGQASAQQKQLLSRLQQVQQSMILQQHQQQPPQTQLQPQLQPQQLQPQLQPQQLQPQLQPQAQQLASNQFSPQQDAPTSQSGTPSAIGNPAQLASLLQPSSVLMKTPVAVTSELKMFSGAPAVATVKQGVTPVSLAQTAQPKPAVISSFGGLSVGNTALQIQVLGSGLAQLTPPQPPSSLQTQTAAVKMPFAMPPSKEARMLEQLRKQQGAVLHPDHSTPFRSFGDALQRLVPYHLYQGTRCSSEDNQKVDEEFEAVSGELLKRTRAMLDKYRLLLFEESRRPGPSAEMVMIDRMFIMEEKTALSQERLLAKERPEEYAALQSAAVAQRPIPEEPSVPAPGVPHPPPTPTLSHLTPTKLVIKQGGAGASVCWSTSAAPPPAPPCSAPAPTRFDKDEDDADALPQRSKKPPIKTYEARRRVGLKLKIKQEAGLSKVVHNTALDPVHHPPDMQPAQPRHHQSRLTVTTATTDRTPACSLGSPSDVSVTATVSLSSHHEGAALPRSVSSSSCPSSSSVTQVNGTLEHRGKDRGNASCAPPPPSCRLPLRKTYRENVSPPKRPGVVGGDGSGHAHCPPTPSEPPLCPQGSTSPPSQTVIASVKVENRGGAFQNQCCTNAGGECGPVRGGGARTGGGGAGGVASARDSGGINTQGKASPAGLMQELAEVEVVFNRRMIKTRLRPQLLHRLGEEEEEDDDDNDDEEGEGRGDGVSRGGCSRERSSRGDRQVRALPSPAGSEGSWDSFIPAKRHKSDSPDMDNASFSSGSPAPDDSLNEHLQSAIDSILNLQQGSPPDNTGRSQGSNLAHPAAASHRRAPSPVSPSVRQGAQAGASSSFTSRGQNGKYVSRTYSR